MGYVPSLALTARVEGACREFYAEGRLCWTSGDLIVHKGWRGHKFSTTSCIQALRVLVEREVLVVRGRSSCTVYMPGPKWGTRP